VALRRTVGEVLTARVARLHVGDCTALSLQ
jgi:hypothetical protein